MDKPAILKEWLAYCDDNRRLSAHTVRAYTKTADNFLKFINKKKGIHLSYSELSGQDKTTIRGFLAHRRSEGLGNRSVARELSALRAFLRFCALQAGHDVTGQTRIKGPKVKKSLPRAVTPDEIAAITEDVAENASLPWVAARDIAVLLLLYGAGLRIAEALALTGGILPLKQSLAVTGKGRKTRIVPILPQIVQAIEEYVALSPYPPKSEQPLFRGVRGGPLSPVMIRRAVQHARVALGLPEGTTPHALRHSFASHLLAAGSDLRSLQELLGHASLSSTQIYTKVDAAQLLDVYKNSHPRG